MHYLYLVETITNDYDVVIVDTNSSLTHVTTFPLLNLSKYCYYILNLDFNNIRNNSRYRSFLEKIHIADKVKYILNENITKKMMDNLYIGSEELLFDTEMIKKDFDLVAEIPLIPKTIFLNRIYSGKPISLENSPQTLEARYEIAKIANEIWPVSNFENLKKEFESKNKETKKFFWKK
jgi:MinD-like ATPase involved in chromosome partitioning or flagellar assembly